MIDQFYVVTRTSVYHVTEKGERGTHPVAEKILGKRGSGAAVGEKLENGTLIAVCRFLLAFVPEGGGITSYEREPAQVNTRWWGGQTTDIVALFKTREEAAECFEHPDLYPKDARWIASTVDVLREIGMNHPSFVVSTSPIIALLPGFELFPIPQ